MQGSIKLLSGEEINKFTTLVRRQEGKLGANDVVRLNPHIYRDYIQKVKYFAGSTSKHHKQSSQPSSVNKPAH